MAKRASKSNTKAAKAAAGPTDDQKVSGAKAQTGAGDKPAPAPNPPEKRLVADTPLVGGANPELVAGEIAKGADNANRKEAPKEKETLARAIENISGEPQSIFPEGVEIRSTTNRQITVVGPKKGFRRAGMTFGKEPKVFDASEITDSQLEALKDEPRLVVSIAEKPDDPTED